VEFEFFDLKPVDFHGLRALFQRYMDGELPFALSELVEALIEQARESRLRRLEAQHSRACSRLPPDAVCFPRRQANSVGAVVKANGDVDPLGVMSVLSHDRHRALPAVQQVRHAGCAGVRPQHDAAAQRET
jgi:hypothetical protein